MPALIRARRAPALLAAACLLAALPAGCKRQAQAAESTIFAMDTVMTLSIHGERGQEALAQATGLIYDLQHALSATDGDSAVYALNHGDGAWTQLDGETFTLLRDALSLCGETGGALDVTAYPAVQAWGFISGDYRVPGQDELDALAASIDYTRVELDGTGLLARLPQGMELELGAVAKGYAGDRLARLLDELGVESALLNLGQSSIQTVGAKPDGSPWRVAIQDPAGTDMLGVVELTGQAIGTSGGYQRFFEEKGQTYWHIIDPETAAPARSGLASVTVVSSSGLVCDGLSTALFVMGLETGAGFWRDNPQLDFDVIFIADDGSVAITPGLEGSFALAPGYEGREMEVLS